MSGIISAAPFNNMFPETKDNSTMQGFTTAIYEIGCLFGAMFILGVGDLLGRRRAIIMGGLIMLVGVIIQITAMSGSNPFAQFIVGRVIMGVGNGINTSTIPTYQAECSKTTNRGLLICIEGGVIAFGTLVAYWIDYGASYGPDDLTWRFPIAFQIVFALIISGPMYFLPESPRWLLTHERYEEADMVLAALRGYELDSAETALERNIIVDSIRASGGFSKSTPYSALFSNGKTQHFRRMMLGASSQLMQQIGGCNAVIYYFPILFQNSIGQSHNMAMLMGGVNMIVYSIFATVSWFVIERVGRRKLFLWGTIGQMSSMIITFSCLAAGGPQNAKGAAVGLFTYIASFGATWLPLPWLYPAEVNPIKTRAKANAVSTCSNWLFNFLIVMVRISPPSGRLPHASIARTDPCPLSLQVTPIMITNIGWGTYLFFAIVNACFLPVIWIFYPETANRSLEEIDIIFAKGYVEKMSYVRAAEEMPFLSDEEVEREALRYGLIDTVERVGHHAKDGDAEAGGVRHRVSSSSAVKDDSEKARASGNESDVADQTEVETTQEKTE